MRPPSLPIVNPLFLLRPAQAAKAVRLVPSAAMAAANLLRPAQAAKAVRQGVLWCTEVASYCVRPKLLKLCDLITSLIL